jgi:hypothetical protein
MESDTGRGKKSGIFWFVLQKAFFLDQSRRPLFLEISRLDSAEVKYIVDICI